MKKVLILGSTGSIGQSTLEVINANNKDFSISGLVAKSNKKLLLEQANKFNVKKICLINNYSKNDIFVSESEIEDLIFSDQVDIVVAAISGIAGLKTILSSIKAGKRILIANKEPLVAAGQILMKEAKKSNSDLSRSKPFSGLSFGAKLSHLGPPTPPRRIASLELALKITSLVIGV